MRIAVAGKGGAGKSTIAGTMARIVARSGTPVLALDSDPLPGLSFSLGSGRLPDVPPLQQAAQRDKTGQWGWSPGIDAATAAQRFAVDAPDGVRLLQRGKTGAEGSAPVTAASKAFWEVVHGLVDAPQFRGWALIGDLPAGPHQIARDWAPYAELYVVVVLPSVQSALTARRVARLARLQTPHAEVLFVANRVAAHRDLSHVERLVGEPVFAAIPADGGVAAAERMGVAPIDHVPDAPAIAAVRDLVARLAARSAEAARN